MSDPSGVGTDPSGCVSPAVAIKPSSSFQRNFSSMFLGNVVYSLCQWGMITALARLGTQTMVGQFALALAVTAPVTMLFNLQLRAVLATDATGDFDFADYYSLRLVSAALAVLVTAGIAVLAGYRLETTIVIVVLALAKAAESVSDIVYGLFQQRERMTRIAVSRIIRGVAALAAVAVGVALSRDILWVVAGLAVVWLALLLVYDLPGVTRMLHGEGRGLPSPRWRAGTLAALTRLALPLGLVMMLSSLAVAIPRYFVENNLGEANLGVFAALGYVMVAGGQVAIALWQTAMPRLARSFASRDLRSFRHLLLRLLLAAVAMGVAGWVVADNYGEPVLRLLYGSDYAGHAAVFRWLMAAAGVMYISSLAGHAMTAVRKLDIQLPLNLLFVVVTYLLCRALVPGGGLTGAAQAILLAMLCQLPLKAAVIWSACRKAGS